MIALLPVVLLIILLLSGASVAFALILSSIIGLFLFMNTGQILGFLGTSPYSSVSGYLLSTIPMFILMAEFLRVSGLTQHIFTAIHRWFGHIRGGLAMATTFANGGMAALSGSSTATAATMSSIAVPEMRKYGYDDRLSMGTVSAAGTFAIMIPPSLGLIVYGVLTETSIARLFIGGIIPGILTLGGYILVIYVWALVNPDVIGGTLEKFSRRERLESLRPVWPALLLVVAVIGGLYSGALTPTESGGVGAFGAFLIVVVVMDVRLDGMQEALMRTAEITTMIFMIVIGAELFGRYLAVSGLTRDLLNFIAALPLDPLIIIVIVMVIYALMGTVMDQLAILILTLPVTYPLAINLGFDSIWFGVLIAKTIEIGLVTPPLGMNVFVASSPLDVDVDIGFRGSMRFLVADFIILGLMIAFPEIVLWLPETMG